MTSFKSIARAAGIILGIVGFCACLAVIIVLWMASNRVGRAANQLFGVGSRSLIDVRERLAQVEERVASAKITATDIETALRDWAKQEAGQRLASQPGVTENCDQLALVLQQADDWLAIAQTSVRFVKDVRSSSGSDNSPVRPGSIDALLEDLVSVRDKMRDAKVVVSEIQDRLAALAEGEPLGERVQGALTLALPLVARLGEVDVRLANAEDRLGAAEVELQNLAAKTHSWIRLVTAGATALLVWMAAGQLALVWLARSGVSNR